MTTEDIEAIKRYVEAMCYEAESRARGETPSPVPLMDAERVLDSMAEDKP